MAGLLVSLAQTLCLVSVAHAQTGLQATYNTGGLATLDYNGVRLVDVTAHPEDSFSVDDYNLGGTAGWGGLGNTVTWDDANKNLTWSWNWGRVQCHYATPAGTNRLLVTLTVTNSSAQSLNGLNIYPFGVRFPTLPLSFVDPNYPQVHNNLDGPVLIPADYQSGMVVLADEDAQPLFLGFSPAPPANRYRLRVGTLGNGNDSFLGTVLPVNRPVPAGQSQTYRFSLRFAPSGTDYHAIASDVLTTFSGSWPMTLSWPDRRPIGELFTSVPTSSPRPDTDPNPRGYWFAPNIDIRTSSGLAAFQQAALSYADNSVTILKNMDAQGAIVWDLEGQQYPHDTSYIGDPSLLSTLAPEMNGIADAFFRKFLDAGLRVGVTIRPQRLVLAGSNTYQDWANMTDPGGVMLQKMRYAHDRWGCTLFYVDSDGGPNDSTSPAIFNMLAQALPDSLVIPENSWTKDFAYTAPLASFWATYKPLYAPPDAQSMWPAAFMVTYIGDAPGGTLTPIYNDLVRAVSRGGILSFRSWFDDQPLNGQVKQIYSDAHQSGGPITVSVAPATVVLSENQPQQFTAAVTGTTNTVVNWSIVNGGPGIISPTGLYTAPASISATQSVTVRATSAADATKYGTVTVTLIPSTTVTVTSSPVGLSLVVDGTVCSAPCTFQWTPGTSHSIDVTASIQTTMTGTRNVFANWSTGGAQSQSITAPSAAMTLTAYFTTQYYLTTMAGAGGTISPPSGWYNSGAIVAVSASATSGYLFAGFSGAITGTGTPQNLAMNTTQSVTATFSPSGPPSSGSYAYRRSISIAHGQVPNTDQPNFPLLLAGTYPYLATVAHGGHVQNAGGYDIVFAADSAGATLLNWDIESYNPATGAVAFWIQIPTLSHTADTVIYMLYGNANISTFQGNTSGTWSGNYAAVYHLADNASNPSVVDSTANGNTGTAQANTNARSTSGEIGPALGFNGSTDYVNGQSGDSFSIVGNITLEAWVKLSTMPSPGNAAYILGKGYNGENESYFLRVETDNDGTSYVEAGTEHFPYTHQAQAPVLGFSGGWHHIVGTYDGNWNVYVDGVQTTSNEAEAPLHTGERFLIGARDSNGGTLSFWNGILEEVRVSNIARTPDWIATEYQNHSSPTTFYSIGPEQLRP
jgi:hypothetical protein